MKKYPFILMAIVAYLTSCEIDKANNEIEKPMARKEAKELLAHEDSRIDNYYWMRLSDEQKNSETPDAQTTEVIDYLNAENAYLHEKLASTHTFQEKLYEEIIGRIKQTDESVPVRVNKYWYYNRYQEGKDYPLNCRKKDQENASEEIMLDQNQLAKGLSYFALGGSSVSPNNELLAYGVDTVSRRQYTIVIKNLITGDLLNDELKNTTGRAVWANDNRTIFYTTKDPQTLRSNKIFKHVLGTPQSADKLVFEETDETFSSFVYKSKSWNYIFIGSSQTLSSEYRFIDANKPNGEWKIIQPREKNLKYSPSHYKDQFYITTNWEAKNFRLMKTSINTTTKENWEEVIPHRADVLLNGIDIFKNYLVISEQKNGLSEIRIIPWNGDKEYYLPFNDPAYLAYTSANPEFDTDILRYGYTSLTTPNSTYDFHMKTQEQELLKQQEVIDTNFSPDNYASERLYVQVRDGAKVPVSLVYKKGMKLDGENPLLLYAYGSYGSNTDPYFSSVRLSLLDRGFIFAIAHVRGGQEMGRQWYEDGKLLKKNNTFYDFIDCGQYLIEEKYTSSDHLYAYGGSAGGLLMGAIINMQPQLWNGVVAAVPFVDVITTMLDESIPLTTGEFDEWGNPKDKTYYDYMKSYSPYDNIEKKDYPNLLITTGYWDSQVQYWEPAKWIAKLRDNKTDDNLLLMHCNMDVGHGGASGRYKRYKELALKYAFLFHLEGIEQ
ncbi:MAG: oligopeptidase B [Bacteroidetes bacterium 4572_77]|nr:MAG: oligopeptidase B [Bacteroidetes bacterium 4572_77]